MNQKITFYKKEQFFIPEISLIEPSIPAIVLVTPSNGIEFIS